MIRITNLNKQTSKMDKEIKKKVFDKVAAARTGQKTVNDTVNEILLLFDVAGQSEQFVCSDCNKHTEQWLNGICENCTLKGFTEKNKQPNEMDKEIKCYRLAKRYPGSPAVGTFVIAVDDDDYTDGGNYYPNEIEHHWEHWEIVPLNEGITWEEALEMVQAVTKALSL